MKEITVSAPAKINLGLDVVRKRPDGYHDLRMIMQTVDLCDELRIKERDEPQILLRVFPEQKRSLVPSDSSNLVYRAADLMLKQYGEDGRINGKGLEITLYKRIPVAAGLAGGSADAAAVLLGINQLFSLGASKKELRELGVKLGADVPYCVEGGLALAEGIGDVLTLLFTDFKPWVLLIKPPIEVSTGYVYTNLQLGAETIHPDIDAQLRAIETGDLKGFCSSMGNVLETVTVPAYPIIQELKEKLKSYGAVNAMMSGSGPTVFGIFSDLEKARQAYRFLQKECIGQELFLTTFY